MLIQFRFQNFKSFKDEIILDLTATKITEHSNTVISVGNERILPVAAIYGANASGKSNVIKAFKYMQEYVIQSFKYGGDSDEKIQEDNKPKLTPFLFEKEAKDKESTFEVYYVDEKDPKAKTYNYGFSLNKDGVVEEWLNVKAKTAREYRRVFFRDTKELDLEGIPTKDKKNLKAALEKETLLVSLGAKLNVEKLKKVRKWFLRNAVINFASSIESDYFSHIVPRDFDSKQKLREKMVEYLGSFDSSIIDFKVETKKNKSGEKNKLYLKIDAVHKMIGGGEGILPLADESDGTKKMFGLFALIKDAMEDGGVLFIDELNDRLHPLLVRAFLQVFLNPTVNKNKAQVVFSTHDTWQLNNDILRRDEIWFTEKDQDGVSSLYSLADFEDQDGDKIRKDENYEKNYLLGKYGAIPNLKQFKVTGRIG